MTTTAYLALVPRDGLFCKDGRGWHTSASGRGHGLEWPWPSTILGALRSALGRNEEARSGTLFGPDEWRARTAQIRLGRTLVLRRSHGAEWKTAHCVWPVPLDALWLEGRRVVHRLDPVQPIAPTLGRDDDDAREALMRAVPPAAGKPLLPPRWWRSEDFFAWLTGQPVEIRERDTELSMSKRVQVHVGIDPERLAADEGVLFSHDVIETLKLHTEWAIGAEVTVPAGALGSIASLGSDRRLARVESLVSALFEPPVRLLEAFRPPSQGLRVAAVTPLCFEKGWLPDGFEEKDGKYVGCLPGIGHEVTLRAAFVPRPIHVSGWDMAKDAPKPTARMVAPGSVYVFERSDGEPFGKEDAESLWLAALGLRTDEGFGRVVPGIWIPKRSSP